MKSAAIGVLLLISVIGLAACSSRSVDTELTRCVYPDSPRTPAPSFICGDSVSGFPVTVLRSSEPMEKQVSDRIAFVLDDQITQWVNAWSLEWFDGSDKLEESRLFLTSYLTENSRVVRSRTSPKSYLWLLIGLSVDVPQLEAITRQAVADSGTE